MIKNHTRAAAFGAALIMAEARMPARADVKD
jgi:hypothetical protein